MLSTRASTFSKHLFTRPTTTFNHINSTSNRSFHASTANMVVKVYFDCTWTGPEAQVDSNGKITSIDKSDKRGSPLLR